MSLRELGKDEDALKSIDKAVELEPDNEEFLFTRADLLKKIGILQGQKNVIAAAVRTFNRIVEINPNDAEAWNGLGVCMKELGKDELSRQYYERAQELVRMGQIPEEKAESGYDCLIRSADFIFSPLYFSRG